MRIPAVLVLASTVLLAGCERNRYTEGNRADVTPGQGAKSDIKVDLGGSIRSSVRIEDSLARLENGFLVVETHVRNTTGRNIPCEWRTVFQDKEGFDLPVTSNPWTPVVINSNETVPLHKTAPVTGGVTATFYIREAAPLRK